MYKTAFTLLLASVGPLLLNAADVNLWRETPFKPIRMNNKISAVKGWYLRDQPRTMQLNSGGKYVPGAECFTLNSENGDFSVTFPTPLNPIHAKSKTELRFFSSGSYPPPPAEEFRVTGKIFFDGGNLRLDFGPRFKPAKEWQTIDVKARRYPAGFLLLPAPGSTFRFADLKVTAVYPESKETGIRLPDGGKLEYIQVPENADYLTRWSIAMWRGWLWKATGIALPLKSVKQAAPAPGSLAVITGKSSVPGGWKLTVDKQGIVLICGDIKSAVPALFDYLRLGLGFSFYAPNCSVIPAADANRVLTAFNREAKPKFAWLSGDSGWHVYNSGIAPAIMNSDGGTDNYHAPWPLAYHYFNTLLPLDIYAKSHPEYFMLNAAGNRVTDISPTMSNPCYSNADALKIMAENLAILAENQADRVNLGFCTADDMSMCVCPGCTKINGGKKSDTEAKMMFANMVAKLLKERSIDIDFDFSAYTTNIDPPKKNLPEYDNIICTFTMGRGTLPCALHHDCAVNKNGIERLKNWSKLFNPDRLGLVTYADIRPRPIIRKLEAMLPVARRSLYMFYWRGFSPATQFIVGRWNLGEDFDKLLKEFEDNYFGAGADGIREVDRIVEECSAVPHTAEELKGNTFVCIWGGDLSTKTRLDRKSFDRIYAAFDRALAAVGDNRKMRLNILQEKVRYMVEDLIAFNRSNCKNEKELAALARRAAALVLIAREHPDVKRSVSWGITGRQLLIASLGLSIPANADWTKVPVVEALVKNPDKALANASVQIPAGYLLTPHAMQGGPSPIPYSYQCPQKLAVPLARAEVGKNSVTTTLNLDKATGGPALIAVEGLDDDKPGASMLQVEVNGKQIFSGKVTFPENNWRSMVFTVPEGLRKGANTIKLTNITPPLPNRSSRFADDPEKGKNDPQWGWICISGITVHDFTEGIYTSSERKINIPWVPILGVATRKVGKVSADGKSVTLRGTPDCRWTGIVFNPGVKKQRPATAPGMKLRFTVRMKGTGELQASAWHYGDDGKYLNMQSFKKFAPVAGQEGVYSVDLIMPSRSRYYEPALLAQGACDLTITDIKFEAVN